MKNIIISRTDSIGDVMLTLPLCGVLKETFPDIKVGFLGKSYTHAVIECCEHVDEFIDVEDFLKDEVLIAGHKPEAILHVFPVAAIAKRARQLHIPMRIGTTNRLYHWQTCNRLVKLSRKNSPLHEAQLNLRLLRGIEILRNDSFSEIKDLLGFTKIPPLPVTLLPLIHPSKYNLILHPKSQGSAREWGLANFVELIRSLDKGRYHILISGTKGERPLLNELFEMEGESVTDITGLMDLKEFISFINHCDGVVANSTGPLHIAAALGKDALGIYPPIRPMHPGRWAPIGKKAHVFVLEKNCNDCRKNEKNCVCIKNILPQELKTVLDKKASNKARSI